MGEKGTSIIGNMNMSMLNREKDHSGMSGAPEIAYKLIQPTQLRIDFKN
jgi:hypothetical protein